MRSTKYVMAMVVVMVCATAVWCIRDTNTADSTEPAARNSEPAKPGPVAREQARPTNARPVSANTNREAPASAPPPESLKHMLAYEASDNLAELTSQLAPVASTGDPGARWILAKSIQECFPPKIYPNYYELGRKGAQTQPEPRRTLTLQHLDRNQRRCAQLLAEGRVTQEAKAHAFEAALQGTDVASQASRLVSASMASSEPIVGDETRSLQRRIVSSRDPWAIWAMADLMGPVPDEGERFYGPFSGTQNHRWAWKLVACRLGYPCGPDSVEVRTQCISASECVNGGVPEMIRHYYLSPHDHELAQATTEELLGLIAAGNVDAIFP